jgi:uncharacterized membrane protein YdfJ with MMPL/SSD domain
VGQHVLGGRSFPSVPQLARSRDIANADGHSPDRPPQQRQALLLLLLGAPFFGVHWGMPDDRVLPTSASAHQVGDQLRTDFANNSATAVPIVITDAGGLADDEIERYAVSLGCPKSRRCPLRRARSLLGVV